MSGKRLVVSNPRQLINLKTQKLINSLPSSTRQLKKINPPHPRNPRLKNHSSSTCPSSTRPLKNKSALSAPSASKKYQTQKHQPITLLPEAPVFCTSPSQASPLQPGKQQAYALLIDTLRIFRSRKFPESIQNLDITIYLKIITPFFISSRSFCIRQQALRKASRTMPSLLISALRNLPNSS